METEGSLQTFYIGDDIVSRIHNLLITIIIIIIAHVSAMLSHIQVHKTFGPNDFSISIQIVFMQLPSKCLFYIYTYGCYFYAFELGIILWQFES